MNEAGELKCGKCKLFAFVTPSYQSDGFKLRFELCRHFSRPPADRTTSAP